MSFLFRKYFVVFFRVARLIFNHSEGKSCVYVKDTTKMTRRIYLPSMVQAITVLTVLKMLTNGE